MQKLLKTLFQFILLCLLSSNALATEAIDKVVAVVNNEVITESQLRHQMEISKQQFAAMNKPSPDTSALRHEALQQLIDKALLLQAAQKSGIKVDDKQLIHAIEQIAARNHLSIGQLQEQLTQQNISFAKYKNDIRNEIIISQLQQKEISSRIHISTQEIEDMIQLMKTHPEFLQSKQIAMTDNDYHLIDILAVPLPAQASKSSFDEGQRKANSIVIDLKKGIDLASLKQTDNTIEMNDLGWRKIKEIPDIFASFVTKLNPGEFSGPIYAPNGFHIIQLVEMKGQKLSNPLILATALPQVKLKLIYFKKNHFSSDELLISRLQQIRQEIIKSNQFSKLAELYSEDPASASKGGETDWISPGIFPPQIDMAINHLKVDELSQPIITPGGGYLIQVIQRRELKNINDNMKEQASQLVFQRKSAETLKSWLQTLRSQSYITINEN